MNKALRITLLVILCILAIAGYGVTKVEAHYSLINLWTVWLPALAAAMAISVMTGSAIHSLTGLSNKWLNKGLCVIATTGILSGAFLFTNHIASSGNVIRTENVVITRIYTETRYRSKRVAPRRYVNSQPYTVYVAELTFPNGRTRTIDIPYRKSRTFHNGDSIKVPIIRGFFGVPFYRYPEILKTDK